MFIYPSSSMKIPSLIKCAIRLILGLAITSSLAAVQLRATVPLGVKPATKAPPQKKSKLPKISPATAARINAIKKQLPKLGSNRKVVPTLQWKYGWRDGVRSNLVGRASAKAGLPKASSTLGTGYAPSDIASAYGFDITSTNGVGNNQTIAVVVAFGNTNIQTDLNAFCSQFGLPSNAVSIAYPSGQPTNADSGWAGETSLDVEWAHAMAPGANLLLVVSPDDSITNMLSAVAYAATNANVVSMSWSTPEFAGQTQYDGLFNVPGVTFMVASGDSGAGLNWPASSTNVVSVGGTSLSIDTNSGYVSESAWNGSGGGVSTIEQLPTWQAGWNVNSGRGVPDVAYNADPYTGVSVYFTDPSATNAGAWYVFGGTSAGAPQWAALAAVNASLGNSGTNTFDQVLYANAGNNYSGLFNDIIDGSNGYPATVGYDLVTGLGSPVANQLTTLPNALPSPTPVPSPVSGNGGCEGEGGGQYGGGYGDDGGNENYGGYGSSGYSQNSGFNGGGSQNLQSLLNQLQQLLSQLAGYVSSTGGSSTNSVTTAALNSFGHHGHQGR